MTLSPHPLPQIKKGLGLKGAILTGREAKNGLKNLLRDLFPSFFPTKSTGFLKVGGCATVQR